MNWSARPFVRIIFFFIIGILIAEYLPFVGGININSWLITTVTLLLIALFIVANNLKHKYIHPTGILLGILITISAILITSQTKITHQTAKYSAKSHKFLAKVISNTTQTDQSVKALLSVKLLNSDSAQTSSQERDQTKVLCYFAKDSSSLKLKYGSVIIFNSKLYTPTNPLNPNEFNYKDYLLQNGISYTTYITTNNWKLIDYSPDNYISAIAGSLRNKILDVLKQYGLSGNTYAVAAAILVGYDNYMENDLQQDYIMAGAMHILCVSGLHVGIIFLVISYLLSFLKTSFTNKIIKAVVLLISIWGYATITGLSPSVQRAGLMLTVFIIGDTLNRNRDTYNTLAASAIILLIINPLLIFNVGFQLSYAAVIGIITFHKPLYNLLYFKNAFADKIWSITVLAFAAQLATFPIATHYFHFFPPWFWLTNLFTFPLSFMIIITGVIFVSTLWIPLLPHIFGWALSGLIFTLNYIVGLVKLLPFSGIDYIYTSIPMLIALYILIVLAFLMLTTKNIKLLTPVLLTSVLIIGLATYHKHKITTQNKIVIYSINKHSAYDFIYGNNHTLLTDSALTSNKINYHIKNAYAEWGITNNNQVMLSHDTLINNRIKTTNNFIYFDDFKILIIDGKEKYYSSNSKLNIDLVVFSGKSSENIKQLSSVFNIKKVIIDSSVPLWKQKKLSKALTELNIDYYNVSTSGALTVCF